jgi:hypothetical protein
MTRFKEKRRIKVALEEGNEGELRWALDYCQRRLGLAARKDHRAYWYDLAGRVVRALEGSAPQR